MKRTTKRVLSAGLASLMIMGSLAGCGGGKEPVSVNVGTGTAGGPDDALLNNEETINLTVFSQTANWSGAQGGWGATLLKDMFNVELTIIPDTDGTAWKRGIWATS